MAQVLKHERAQASIPASAGIGLRSRHVREILDGRAKVAWFEVHSENYFSKGGAPLRELERIRADYPISLHGVGLSLGSVDPADRSYLASLKRLIERIEPALVSDHLSWSSFGGVFLNDLLPLPYHRESLKHMVERVQRTQDALGRQILIENPSSYLEYRHSTFTESEFLVELSRRSGCGILLDINNVYVSCQNHGWNAQHYLRGIPGDWVGEIHLGGHTVNRWAGGEIWLDTHNRPVCDEVWRLYETALWLMGPKPTLIEWDADIPELDVLQGEASKAEMFLEMRHERVA
ncbi:MAG: MNIO family bufferin maturase [Gammaproteobacteria bacterium]